MKADTASEGSPQRSAARETGLVLLITAVEAEARAIGSIPGVRTIVSGIGRTNAACATTEHLLGPDRYAAVVSAGIAGILPGTDLQVGDALIASECVYCEEGIVTSGGFSDVRGIGMHLGDFAGNAVPVDETLLERCGAFGSIGPIATVATCSGTDQAATAVQLRTGALAEAMEGAAVVHAARRLRVPAIELRVMSNRTGERSRQGWNLDLAFERLGPFVRHALNAVKHPD